MADDSRVQEALAVLDVWLQAQLDYDRIPGISAAIVHDQELVWSAGYGFADIAARRPATPSTIYSICSISKLFTSIAVMQQRDAGKLRLHDPVADLLPWFEIDQQHAEAGLATVRGLLTHSAGLPRESAHPYWTGPDFPFPSRQEVIEGVTHQSTLYPADTYFQYSNLGLTLAGELVAQVSGQPYGEYVREHILDPLGMSSTTPEIPVERSGEMLATGYGPWRRSGEREAVTLFQARGIAPAAGYASSVQDMARFASWQLRLLETGGEELLAANTLRQMHRVHSVDPDWSTHWGLGFSVSRRDDKTFVGHGGSCPGFRSSFTLQTKAKFGAVAMANAMGVNPGLYTRRSYELVGPAIAKAVAEPDGAKPHDPELDEFVGRYESAWGETAIIIWQGKLASMSPASADPVASITKLERVEGDVFRRKRDDGDLGEEWVFERDGDGNVVRLQRNGNYSERVR